MKKKLIRNGLLALAVMLALFHTQLVESPLASKLEHLAAEAGVTLTIGRLDLNMFTLKVRLREIHIEGMGLVTDLETVEVNASIGSLIGRVSLDEVLVTNGKAAYTPPPPKEDPVAAKPIELPPIYLGHAAIHGITVTVNEQSTEVNLELKQVEVRYEDQHLAAGFQTLPTKIAGRDLPRVDLAVEANTTDFLTLEDLTCTVLTPQSWFVVSGRMDEGFLPVLTLDAEIAADLLPEQPGLHIAAAIQPWLVSATVTGNRELAGEQHPFEIDTAFDMAGARWDIPLHIQFGELVGAHVDLIKHGSCLSAEAMVTPNPEAVMALVPQVSVTAIDLQAWVDIDLAAPPDGSTPTPQPAADFLFRVQGDQSVTLAGGYAQEQLDFNGWGMLFQGSEFNLAGVLSQQGMQADAQVFLPGLDGLETWVDLPPELCTGPVDILASMETDFTTWTLAPSRIMLRDTTYGEILREDLMIDAQGDATSLVGGIGSSGLNALEPLVLFDLNLEQQTWQHLSLHLVDAPISVAGFDTTLTLLADGEGPMLMPDMNGTASVGVNRKGPLAQIENHFQFVDQCIMVNQLHVASALAQISGKAAISLGDQPTWDADLVLNGGSDPNFRAWPIAQAPNFHMVLRGNQDTLTANLILPDQLYPFEQTAIPIGDHGGMQLSITPGGERVDGASQSMQVAGINLSEISLGIKDDQFHAAMNFDAKNMATLKKTLAPWWPQELSLVDLSGRTTFNAPLSFDTWLAEAAVHQIAGSFDNIPFDISKGSAQFDGEQLTIAKPFTVLVPGARAEISQTGRYAMNPQEWVPGNTLYPIALSANFSLEHLDEFQRYFPVPPEVESATISGSADLHADLSFEDTVITMRMEPGEGVYDGHYFTVTDLVAGYNNTGVWLHALDADLDGLPLKAEKRPDGFVITAEPSADYLAGWMDDITGDAEMLLEVSLTNVDDDQKIVLNFRQKSGRLVHVDPWMVVTGLELQAIKTEEGYRIEQGSGILNGGAVSVTGMLTPTDEGADITVNMFADQINLDMLDYKANVTAVMEFTDVQGEASLSATVVINSGYLTPTLEIKSMISELLSSVPELYFPDPALERVQLKASVIMQNPIFLEHEIAFLEMETPTLIIGGNLAEPVPYAGPLNIREGSSLDLGNRTYIFKESQVQFHPNRPDDPYLQLVLESTQYGKKSSLNLSGYLSELGRKVDSNSMTDILTNFLISQVSTMVSLQLGHGETSFDNSFTFVVSTPITRWLVTRYAVPVNEGKADQRFELTMGPFYYNLINLVQQRDNLRGSIQHTQSFGYLDREEQQLVRRIKWPKGTERWVRKGFKIKKGDLWSPSQWRRSELDLQRRLRGRGYLQPTISHRFEKSKLTVNLDMGPKTTVVVEGFALEPEDRHTILRTLREKDADGLRAVERLVERLAIKRNHPYALATARMDEHILHIEVLLGTPFDGVTLTFGEETDALIGHLYTNAADRNQLVAGYLDAHQTAEDKLRAQLAALGYLQPTLERGDFLDVKAFSIPIDPGKRGVLEAININGKGVDNDLVGKPFHYTMIDEMVTRLTKQDKDAVIKVRPERHGGNIQFNIEMQDIPETIIENLEIDGAARLTEARIRKFVGFKKQMTQQELSRAQERLIAAGPFETVRLQHNETSAVLELEEGNRWDVDFQLSLEELDQQPSPFSQKDNRQFGASVRFLDHQFLNRFITLAAQIEFNEQTARILSQLKFLRVLGTPIDVSVGVDWQKENDGILADEFVDLDFGEAYLYYERVDNREWRADLSYELSRYQNISFGFRVQKDILNTRTTFYDGFAEDPFDPVNELDEITGSLTTTQVPLRLSWLYRRLDHPTNPANGIFTSLAAEYYLDTFNADEALLGTWLDARFTSFKTWERWMWSQRLEVGAYLRDAGASRPDDPTTSPLFLLGGARTVRGFDLYYVGPLDVPFDPFNEDGEVIDSLDPLGGESMFFFSQELSFDTRLFGLGINPFIDGGWVWENHDDLFSTDLVITGGLGLSLDLPIGYFRLDWARPLSEGPFKTLLDQNTFDDEIRAYYRKQALQEFSFVFGRTF